MCIAKVNISSLEEFDEAERLLKAGGYDWKGRRSVMKDGNILLWKNFTKKTLSRAIPTVHPFCRKLEVNEIAKFCKGRRKTAHQCKSGVWRISEVGEITYFATVKLAAEDLGVRPMNIYKAANPNCKELKTAYNYEWTYKRPR